MHKTQ